MRFDTRSPALFRTVLGVCVLSQTILIYRDFAAFYQADGLTPPSTFVPLFPSPIWSDLFLQLLLTGILPLVSLSLIVGLFTRFSIFVCWLVLLLIHTANPQVLQGGDVLLCLLLFWGLFLPLGEAASLDARYPANLSLSLPLTTELAIWALTLQICFVYWFAAILKSDPLWTQNGNALFFAFNIEHFTTPFGLYLRQYPDLLRVLTFATLTLEVLGPCLLFIPYHRDKFRFLAVILFLAFHLIGMESLLSLDVFPLACALAWLLFIPGFFWQWLLGSTASNPNNSKQRRLEKAASKIPQTRSSQKLDYAFSILVAVAFLDVLAWNIASVSGNPAMAWMNRYDFFGKELGLAQRWNMYAPYPWPTHGWLVVPANLASGNQVDLFTGHDVTYAKPANIADYMGSYRWRRYLSNLFNNKDPQALQGYADYLVRQWDQQHSVEEKIQDVSIIYMEQTTLPDLTVSAPERKALYFHAY